MYLTLGLMVVSNGERRQAAFLGVVIWAPVICVASPSAPPPHVSAFIIGTWWEKWLTLKQHCHLSPWSHLKRIFTAESESQSEAEMGSMWWQTFVYVLTTLICGLIFKSWFNNCEICMLLFCSSHALFIESWWLLWSFSCSGAASGGRKCQVFNF